jgi:hypothetical protein
MTTGNFTITPEAMKQIELLLSDIAAKASTMKNISSETLQHCGRGPAASMVSSMEPIASQIGYMAEICLKRLGDRPAFSEGAEYWFIPEVCRENYQPGG